MKLVRVLLVFLGALAMLLGFAGTATAAAYFVSVPANYVYNPSLGARNDYCTYSPDQPYIQNQVPPEQRRIDFRGPCARHDMCYNNTFSKQFCDSTFRTNLTTQCNYFFQGTGYLPDCYRTRDVYYDAVVRFGNADSFLTDNRPDVYLEEDWVEANQVYLEQSSLLGVGEAR